MRGLYRSISFILLGILFFQCQKEISYIGGPDAGVVVPEPITAILQGNVLDESGQPAPGATIKVGNKTAVTDARGYFRIPDASLDKVAAVVTAEKPGYFKAYRTFGATSGTNQVVIKLIKKAVAGSVDAAAGGSVTLGNGTVITLPANGIVTANGAANYTGTVLVHASYIDPTAADIAQIIPGSLMAIDKNNNRVVMASYGMLAVELETPTGEKLQIKQGSAATLNAPIPSSLLASAPATIAMWYVDEQTGMWREEGSATKQGSNYVGEVKHFSFWNYDISIPAVNLSLTLHSSDGHPIVHAQVRITRVSGNGGQAYGYTDSLGQVNGLVPMNENLKLEVLSQCNNVIYTQNISPLTHSTNLGTITLTNTGASVVTFTGKLLNCAGSAIAKGYAVIRVDNMVRYAAVNANGEFSATMTVCSSLAPTAEIIGVDEAAQQQGAAVGVSIVAPQTQAGNITACGTSASQYINYTLDGVNYSLTNLATDSLTMWTMTQGTAPYLTSVSGFSMSNNNTISFNFSGALAPGTYPISNLYVQDLDSNTLTQPFNTVVTSFPLSAGQFYEGSFSGQFRDGLNINHTLSGTYRVRRNW